MKRISFTKLRMLRTDCCLKRWCSTFFFPHRDGFYFGKNIDYPSKSTAHGLILINPRERGKKPLVFNNIPAEPWNAPYGSLTYTAFGKNIPNGGINEMGLVLEPMTLCETEYPPIDKTPRLHLGQWLQYVLDSFSTVAEVISNISMVTPFGHTSHFLVSDARGDCAAIEFLKGKPVIHTKDTLQIPAMTDHSYEDCCTYVCDYKGFGGSKPIPKTHGSRENFIHIATRLKDKNLYKAGNPVEQAFLICDSAAHPDLTKQSHVYDIKNRKTYVRPDLKGHISSVDMNSFDFSRLSKTLMIRIENQPKGDCTNTAEPLTRDMNLRTSKEFSQMLLEVVPENSPVPLISMTFKEMLDRIQHYTQTIPIDTQNPR